MGTSLGNLPPILPYKGYIVGIFGLYWYCQKIILLSPWIALNIAFRFLHMPADQWCFLPETWPASQSFSVARQLGRPVFVAAAVLVILAVGVVGLLFFLHPFGGAFLWTPRPVPIDTSNVKTPRYLKRMADELDPAPKTSRPRKEYQVFGHIPARFAQDMLPHFAWTSRRAWRFDRSRRWRLDARPCVSLCNCPKIHRDLGGAMWIQEGIMLTIARVIGLDRIPFGNWT